MNEALHFVGLDLDSLGYARAVQVFGKPDFVHRRWDWRAVAEIISGDTVVFVQGVDPATISDYAYDDSAYQ